TVWAVRLTDVEARKRFDTARVARLATASADGLPHVVPIVFTLHGDVVYTAVHGKPKASTALRRLCNIAANPRAALLADHDEDDWTQLWWARADGLARLAEAAEAANAIGILAQRYTSYRSEPPPGPVVAIDVTHWSGWSAS